MVASLQTRPIQSARSGGPGTRKVAAASPSHGTATAERIVDSSASAMSSQPSRSVGSLLAEIGKRYVTAGAVHTVVENWRMPPVGFPDFSMSGVSGAISVPEALQEIELLSGLPKVQIAEKMLGVSRESLDNWANAKAISVGNESKVRGTLDVLQRAAKVRPSADQVRGWLLTPIGGKALRPLDLIAAGRLDEARLLAVTTASPGLAKPLPWANRSITAEWANGGESPDEAYYEPDDLLIRAEPSAAK